MIHERQHRLNVGLEGEEGSSMTSGFLQPDRSARSRAGETGGVIWEIKCRTGIQFWIRDAGFDLSRARSVAVGQERKGGKEKRGMSTLNEYYHEGKESSGKGYDEQELDMNSVLAIPLTLV